MSPRAVQRRVDDIRFAATALPLIALALLSVPAFGQTQSCDTALSRIAKKAADKAISERRDNACSGLKKGPFGIDKTKALQLKSFSVCESGPVVTASALVHIHCATSDQAMLSASVEDDVTIDVSANLDTCQILSADVSAAKLPGEAGIGLADVRNKLREGAAKAIKDYCS